MTTYRPQSYGGIHVPDDVAKNMVLPYDFFPKFGEEKKISKGFNLAKYLRPLTMAGAVVLWVLAAAASHPTNAAGVSPYIVKAVFLWILCSLIMRGRARVVLLIVGFLTIMSFNYPLTILPLTFLILSFLKPYDFMRGLFRNRHGFPPAGQMESYRSVWGAAGAHVAENKAFEGREKVGAEGERITGAALDKFAAEHPFVRVFHGLQFTPGKDGADVDHAVLIGNNVIMVDSKNWMIADYVMTPDRVIRNGQEFPGGDVKMGSALLKWNSYLYYQKANVSARIVMVKPESLKSFYRVENHGGNPRYELVTLNTFMNQLEWLANNTAPVVDRYLVQAISQLLQ